MALQGIIWECLVPSINKAGSHIYALVYLAIIDLDNDGYGPIKHKVLTWTCDELSIRSLEFSAKFKSKYINFHITKWVRKCQQNISHQSLTLPQFIISPITNVTLCSELSFKSPMISCAWSPENIMRNHWRNFQGNKKNFYSALCLMIT